MARYLFFSHDGFGLGHVRRNSLIARALLDRDPASRVAIVTGVAVRTPWARTAGIRTIRVPPLVKDAGGRYRAMGVTFEEAVLRRATIFSEAVSRLGPAVVVVDRHPFGTAGELRDGLRVARSRGAAVVLGLRDVLDEPQAMREELAAGRWDGVDDVFDDVVVYGAASFFDHEAEWGLPARPRYCGWVTDRAPRCARDPRLLAVSVGGGGDGLPVLRLGTALLERRPSWSAEVVAGPYSDRRAVSGLSAHPAIRGRVTVTSNAPGCAGLFTRAGAVLQMAGYNSTFEALAAGLRPILVPRRRPRAEQAIRARRLAAMGLADVVDEDTDLDALSALLDGLRTVSPRLIHTAGVDLSGAERVAGRLAELASGRTG